MLFIVVVYRKLTGGDEGGRETQDCDILASFSSIIYLPLNIAPCLLSKPLRSAENHQKCTRRKMDTYCKLELSWLSKENGVNVGRAILLRHFQYSYPYYMKLD